MLDLEHSAFLLCALEFVHFSEFADIHSEFLRCGKYSAPCGCWMAKFRFYLIKSRHRVAHVSGVVDGQFTYRIGQAYWMLLNFCLFAVVSLVIRHQQVPLGNCLDSLLTSMQ